ncbi:MAG TPA: 30S ribosomal protein S17 [Candidatus Paceibacterota bacterium]|nr:30S ribosomal protein S17 [Candidatus Paceibacterota bacterium]
MVTSSSHNAITLKGIVVSDKMHKTVVVAVTRFVQHPKYKKFIKVTKKFKAHDEGNVLHEGDRVVLRQTRPLSKEKHFEAIKESK